MHSGVFLTWLDFDRSALKFVQKVQIRSFNLTI